MNFNVSTINYLGSWRAKWCWLQSPPLFCYMTEVLKNILQRPTIALLLHRISHVAHCVCILTKALPLFILHLKIAYVELMVGESGSMLLRHIYCKIKQWIHADDKSYELIKIVHVWKWMVEMKYSFYGSLSLLWGHGYIFFSLDLICPNIYILFFVMLFGHAIFSLFSLFFE